MRQGGREGQVDRRTLYDLAGSEEFSPSKEG
jgi:hypothetical protein